MIREAVLSDFSQVQTVVKEVHNLHYKSRPDVYNDVAKPLNQKYFKDLLNDIKVKVFIKEIENEIVAYAIIKMNKTQNIPMLKPSIYIYVDDLAVKSSHRKKGFGKALFQYILQFAKVEKADSIQLNVWEFNKPAIKFYESIGMNTRNRRMEIDINKQN